MRDEADKVRAEIIAIGDEMTSGVRLDTNTQWLSQRLNDIGIQVAFHSTVGDDLQDNIDVFRVAAARADVVVSTGGLGPTEDDLTRSALAAAAGVELEFDQSTLEHIERIFAAHGREMPSRNRQQAYFPAGSSVIENPEGTAPGIDFEFSLQERPARFFCLPGVPAEMKQMWKSSIEPALRLALNSETVIHHHAIHCFGTGESQTEEMLPELIRRGRHPSVGITASAATITLRVSAQAENREACLRLMQPTLDEIRNRMGPHVFGENGQQLNEVVAQRLQEQSQTVAIVDCGLDGAVGESLLDACPPDQHTMLGSLSLSPKTASQWLGESRFELTLAAERVRSQFNADWGIAIGSINYSDPSHARGQYEVAINSQAGTKTHQFNFGGHSSFRKTRSVKQVLNQLRLNLLEETDSMESPDSNPSPDSKEFGT